MEHTNTTSTALVPISEQVQAIARAGKRAARIFAAYNAGRAARIAARIAEGKPAPTHSGAPIIYSALCGLCFSGAELWELADRAAYYTIKSRQQSTSAPLFRELAYGRQSDRHTVNAPALAAAADVERRTVADLAKLAKSQRNQAARIDCAPAKARDLIRAAQANERQAARHTSAAHSLEAAFTVSASDRADLVQAAAMALIDTISTAPADEPPAQLLRVACRGAQSAINALAHPDAMRRSQTQRRKISAEEYQRHIATYGAGMPAPAQLTKSGKQSCVTVEVDKHGQYWRVLHYYTLPPYVYYEQYTEQGIEYADNRDPLADVIRILDERGKVRATSRTRAGINAIQQAADVDGITAMFERANLSERERVYCFKAASQSADAHAEEGRKKYCADREKDAQSAATPQKAAEIRAKSKPFSKPAIRAAQDAREEYARAAVGIEKSAFPQFKTRLKARFMAAGYLSKSGIVSPDPYTPADKAEQERTRAAKRMQYRPHTAPLVEVSSTANPRPWWMQSKPASQRPRPLHASGIYIIWRDAPNIPADAWRAEPIEDEPRVLTDTERRAVAALAVRRRYRDSQPEKFAQIAAQARAAGVDELQIWAEIASAEAQAQHRAALDKIRADYPTLDEWRKMSRADRDKWEADWYKAHQRLKD